MHYQSSEKPVFFGHYWLKGKPIILKVPKEILDKLRLTEGDKLKRVAFLLFGKRAVGDFFVLAFLVTFFGKKKSKIGNIIIRVADIFIKNVEFIIQNLKIILSHSLQ